MPQRVNPTFAGYLYVAVAAIIWGSNGVIVNVVPLNASVIAFFRVFFASIVLLPAVLLTRRAETVRAARSWKTMLSLGVLLALGWLLLFQSMKLITIANAVLLNYTAPIFVALLAPLFLNEKLERSTLVALPISVAGIVVIAYQQNLQMGDPNLLGVSLGLLSGFVYAGFTIASKKALFSFSSQVAAFYAFLIAWIVLFPFVIGANLSVEVNSWILLLVFGVLNTAVAVTLYFTGIRRVKAQKGVIFTYLEPVSAVVFGFFFLAQQPTPLVLVGGSLILIAGYIVVTR